MDRILPKVYTKFGKEIKSLRTFGRLTQLQVAERVGLPREAIVAIEKGRYGRISLDQLISFSKAFGVDPLNLATVIFRK